jgi:hypothetical protein
MPQINVYTYLSQASWVLIIFIIYYINMKQILIPSILEKIRIRYFLFNSQTYSFFHSNLKTSSYNPYLF